MWMNIKINWKFNGKELRNFVVFVACNCWKQDRACTADFFIRAILRAPWFQDSSMIVLDKCLRLQYLESLYVTAEIPDKIKQKWLFKTKNQFCIDGKKIRLQIWTFSRFYLNSLRFSIWLIDSIKKCFEGISGGVDISVFATNIFPFDFMSSLNHVWFIISSPSNSQLFDYGMKSPTMNCPNIWIVVHVLQKSKARVSHSVVISIVRRFNIGLCTE